MIKSIKKGLISCILTTYNRVELLEKRIDELMKQSYQDFEIIIINDCSSDKTKEYLDSLRNPKISTIIHLDENSGGDTIPRAIGISHASGEFIVNCDDDVISLPNKLKTLIEAFDYKHVLVYGDRLDYFKNVDRYKFMKVENWIPDSSGVDDSQILYPISVYKHIPFVVSYNAGDMHLCRKIYSLGKFKHVSEVVSIYIWHETNRSLKSPKNENIERELHKKMQEKLLRYEKYFDSTFKTRLEKI